MHDYILHDLTQNKTLELGKDFLYGGDYIFTDIGILKTTMIKKDGSQYTDPFLAKKYDKTPFS
jgi:hypothetical protein